MSPSSTAASTSSRPIHLLKDGEKTRSADPEGYDQRNLTVHLSSKQGEPSIIGKPHALDDSTDTPEKRRRTHSSETHVEDLLNTQFSDSTHHPPFDQASDSTTAFARSPRLPHSTTSYLRAANGAPAEGPGLRGADHEVDIMSEGYCPSQDYPLNATGGPNVSYPPNSKRLCIRHQSMADEDKTAKLQKVSSMTRMFAVQSTS